MRMPRVRLTVRTLMLGVALSALVISLAAWREAVRRASHYRILADQHANLARIALLLIRETEDALLRPDYECSELDVLCVRQYRQEATYYAALTAKYEEAARHPLSPVTADPPSPVRVTQPEVMRLTKRRLDPSEAMRLINGKVDPRKRGDGDERSE